jgi:predicted phosphodiesterase
VIGLRYAVLADVHANLHALEAVLAATAPLAVDHTIVAGDLVGYGPQPNECVARIAEIGASCVAGNHDLIVLGELSDARCIPMAQRSLHWTRSVLDSDATAFLAALPRTLRLHDEVTVAHGSIDDPEEYVSTSGQAVAQLAQLGRSAEATPFLLVGHTHRAALWSSKGTGASRGEREAARALSPWLLNPGSVGQSRERAAHARFALLDTESGNVSFRAVDYDVAACRAALVAAGLDPDACHMRPGAARATARSLKLTAARMVRAGGLRRDRYPGER